MGTTRTYQVPLLAAGRHTHPRRGGCLVEVAGALPGGSWTDRPAWGDPVLAALARAVNDATSDAGRRALAPLAPWLLVPPGPDQHLAGALAVLHTAGTALSAAADPAQARVLSAALDAGGTARAVGPVRPLPSGLLRHLRWRRQAVHAVRLAAAVVAANAGPAGQAAADDELSRLLTGALDRWRHACGLPPVPAPPPEAQLDRGCVTVATQLVRPDGAESLSLHCRVQPGTGPGWLQQGWAARQAELAAGIPQVMAPVITAAPAAGRLPQPVGR